MISLIVKGCTPLSHPRREHREKIALALDIILALSVLALGLSRLGVDKGWWKSTSSLDALNQSLAIKLMITGGVYGLAAVGVNRLVGRARPIRAETPAEPQFEPYIPPAQRFVAPPPEVIATGEEAMRSIKSDYVSPSDNCAICISPLLPADPSEERQRLMYHTAGETQHIFHDGCIKGWLAQNAGRSRCPTCRAGVASTTMLGAGAIARAY